MNKYKILASFAFALISFSYYATSVKKQISDSDIDKLLSDQSYLCEAHITGAPSQGKAGPHIIWKAYSSDQSPEILISKYTKQLGLLPDDIDQNCSLWRYKPDKTEKILEICTKQSLGPWNNCKKTSVNTKTIIINSSISR